MIWMKKSDINASIIITQMFKYSYHWLWVLSLEYNFIFGLSNLSILSIN